MMNGLQTLNQWQDYFGKPTGSTLGIFNAIQSIGGIAGLPFAPYITDRLGRRWTIFLGCCCTPLTRDSTRPSPTCHANLT